MTTFPATFTNLRTCYRHPAGLIGVALTSSLEQLRWLERIDMPSSPLGGYRLAEAGAIGLNGLGIPTQDIVQGVAHKACADYTQRLPDGGRGVPHIGGALGAALTQWLLDSGFAERLRDPKSIYERRALALTTAGYAGLVSSGLIDRTMLGALEGAEARS